jgi:hypothetical protein
MMILYTKPSYAEQDRQIPLKPADLEILPGQTRESLPPWQQGALRAGCSPLLQVV